MVKLYTDNKNASIISMKGSMSLRLQRQVLKIFQFCAMNNVTVEIEWIPRSLNEYADSLSRVVDFDDWSVSTVFFDYIASLFGSLPKKTKKRCNIIKKHCRNTPIVKINNSTLLFLVPLIRWNFTSVLEDLDFADDIALISSKYEHIQSKTDRLVENAGRVGLKLNAAKWKMMRSKSMQDGRTGSRLEKMKSKKWKNSYTSEQRSGKMVVELKILGTD